MSNLFWSLAYSLLAWSLRHLPGYPTQGTWRASLSDALCTWRATCWRRAWHARWRSAPMVPHA